jgi:phosphatidate cytidylyltransferase
VASVTRRGVGDLPRRTITAVIYAAVVVIAVIAPPVAFWLLLCVATALGVRELLALRTGTPSLLLGALFVAGLASLGALRQLGDVGAHHAIARDVPVWLLLAVLPMWAADVVAYLVGSAFGRRRLAPRISPGKTWEGTLAGLVAAGLGAFGLGALFGLGRGVVAVAAIAIGLVGLGGDLFESYVKRRAGVKDSGTLLPGHGGVLDRLDSVVASGLFVLVLVALSFAAQLGGEGG